MATIDSTILGHPDVSPEKKLALLKINSSHLDGDILSEPDTSRHHHANGFHSHARSSSARGVTRTASKVTSANRRSSSFIQSHRNKMSMDLTSQAETKFFALMEFMSSASREASSLKEYWSKLMAERESFAQEREELMARVEEVTETLEQKESMHSQHGHEAHERKKEVERLLIELSAALSAVSDQKKKVSERDQELDRIRHEVHDLRISISRDEGDRKSEYDSVQLRLRTAESERDHARSDLERHRNDFRNLTREHTELKSKSSDFTMKLETARKEVSVLTERIRAWEREREDYLHDKDLLQEELRRANHKAEETSKELTSLNERYGHIQKEAHKARETVHMVESERDEHHSTIEHLRHEVRMKTSNVEDAESRYADLVLKHEKAKRDATAAQDRLRETETELIELRSSVERKQEEYRLIVVEKDSTRDELDDERRKHADTHRQLNVLQESLSRTEATLSELRSEHHTVTERIRFVERERDQGKDQHGSHQKEVADLKEQLALLQVEIKTLTEHRDHAHKELHDYKRKYEEVTEEITEFNNDSGELEYEIESLRTMLRESREQKERAIAARATADRERDEALSRYEEKCREMERYEESRSSFMHSHSSSHGGGRMSSTRTVTRSSGMHGHSHTDGAHENSHADT